MYPTIIRDGKAEPVLTAYDGTSSLMLSFPHSGSIYPDDFGYRNDLAFEQIDHPCDKYVDELFAEARALDLSTLKANFPRAYLDVNRHQHDIDVEMLGLEEDQKWYGRLLPGSVKVGATLFWSKAYEIPIYDRQLSHDEAKSRLARCFTPYHQTMTSMIHRLYEQHNVVYLVDCHSMTQFDSKMRGGKQRPEVDIGTRNGHSCAPDLADELVRLFQARGYQAGCDKRFIGGEITLRYGWPEINQHALQIELRRDIYMNEATRARNANFAQVQADCAAILRDFKTFVEHRSV